MWKCGDVDVEMCRCVDVEIVVVVLSVSSALPSFFKNRKFSVPPPREKKLTPFKNKKKVKKKNLNVKKTLREYGIFGLSPPRSKPQLLTPRKKIKMKKMKKDLKLSNL